MATSNKVFVSPGVYTSEFELSFIAQSVGVTTLGLVGETLKGPAFEPIFIRNFEEFITFFGDTAPEKFINTQIPKYETAYIAKAYLQQSNQLFVTRILGLSGYDAGPSWSITTIGGVNQSSVIWDCEPQGSNPPVQPSTSTDIQNSVSFTAYTSSTYTSVIIDVATLISWAPFDVNSTFTYNSQQYSILSALQLLIQNVVDDYYVNGNSSAETDWAGLFGPTGNPGYLSYPSLMNFLSPDNLDATLADLAAPQNLTWINLFASSPSTGIYDSWSLSTDVSALDDSNPGYIVGDLNLAAWHLSGSSYSDYDNIVIATFRSRGVSDYTIVDGGPVYEVSTLSNVSMDCPNDLSTNPFLPFVLCGTTDAGENFTLDVSLLRSDSKYITKVLGVENFDKDRLSVPIFVEEAYPTLLEHGFNYGYIAGVSCTLLDLEGARQQEDAGSGTNSIGWYMQQYQTPETPWVVSQLQGNKVTRLFKFISISDGNAANTEVKISISNLSYVNNTFDVGVRMFNDTDSNPVFIERYTSCSMDPDSPGYVAKKIGTANGEYGQISRYIMLEMNYAASFDSLPCGFEGYIQREYDTATPPFPVYKTKYNYPGEPLYGNVLSNGDKVRRTYLGFSDKIGYDPSLLQYKGRQFGDTCGTLPAAWDYQTRGFHLDSGATVCTIGAEYTNSGTTAFEVGPGDFTSEPQFQTNPYYYLYSRKFTLVFQGGFDGWNIYDEHRTNGDNFQIGRGNYLNSACPSPRFPNAQGRLFRQITIDADTVNWSTTDYYAYLLGIRTYNNPASININVFATPGIDYLNNLQLVSLAIDMVENDRADSIYITTTPDWEMFTSNSTDFTYFIQPEDAVTILEDTQIDSNYTATYYPWVLTRDTVNNTQIYIPPTAEVCRNLALTDNISFPWFATAGYTRGLVNSVKARKKLTQDDRDELYTGRINPIATFGDVGTVIWGNKTLQISESSLNRINVRRLLIQARKLISAVAIRLLFEQNDQKVRQDFLDAVNPILDAIRRDRGLYDFRVTVSNSPEDFDKQQLTGKVYIKPTKALEFIDIQFYITPLGASFENI